MPRRPVQLTPDLIREIATRVRGGAFPQVAAEAAGVPAGPFAEWMRRGSRPGARGLYRELVEEVRYGQAHSRCMAEIALRQKDPRTWLLSGPGKGTTDRPGWSGAVRGQLQAEGYAGNPLLQAQIQALLARLMDLLEPHPEARAAVAAALATPQAARSDSSRAQNPSRPAP
jgi:hypothetical protein